MGNANSTQMIDADSAALRAEFHNAVSQSPDLKTLNVHINNYLSNPANNLSDIKASDIPLEHLLYRKHMHRDIFTPHQSAHKRMNSIKQYNFAESYLVHRDYLNTGNLSYSPTKSNSPRKSQVLPFYNEPVIVDQGFHEMNQAYNQNINLQLPTQRLLEPFGQQRPSDNQLLPFNSANAHSRFRESLASRESFSSDSYDEGNLMSPPTSQDEWFSEPESSPARNSTFIPEGLTSEQAQAELLDLLEQAIPLAKQPIINKDTPRFERKLTVKELNSARSARDLSRENEISKDLKAQQKKEMERKLKEMEKTKKKEKKHMKNKKSKSSIDDRPSTPVLDIKPAFLCRLTPGERTLTYPSSSASPSKEPLNQVVLQEKRSRRATVSHSRGMQTTDGPIYQNKGVSESGRSSPTRSQNIGERSKSMANTNSRRYTFHESSRPQGAFNQAMRSAPNLSLHAYDSSSNLESEDIMNYSSWVPSSPVKVERNQSQQCNYDIGLAQAANKQHLRGGDDFDFGATDDNKVDVKTVRRPVTPTRGDRPRSEFHPRAESRPRTEFHPRAESRPRTEFHPRAESRPRTESRSKSEYRPKSAPSDDINATNFDANLASADNAYPYRPVSQALPDFGYRQYTGRFGRKPTSSPDRTEVHHVLISDDNELNVGIPPKVPPHKNLSNPTNESSIGAIDLKQTHSGDADFASSNRRERGNSIKNSPSTAIEMSPTKSIGGGNDTSIYTRKCSFIRAKNNTLSSRSARSNTVSESPKNALNINQSNLLVESESLQDKKAPKALNLDDVNKRFMLDGYENDTTTLKCVNWTRDSLMTTDSGSEDGSNQISRETSMENLKVNQVVETMVREESVQANVEPATAIDISDSSKIPPATSLKRNNTITPVTILDSSLQREDSEIIHVKTNKKLSRYSTIFDANKANKEKQMNNSRRKTISAYTEGSPVIIYDHTPAKQTQRKSSALPLGVVDSLSTLDIDPNSFEIPVQNPRRHKSTIDNTEQVVSPVTRDTTTIEAAPKMNSVGSELTTLKSGKKTATRCFSGLNFLEEEDLWTGRGDKFLQKTSFIVID